MCVGLRGYSGGSGIGVGGETHAYELKARRKRSELFGYKSKYHRTWAYPGVLKE
jgi:hypothetical protein